MAWGIGMWLRGLVAVAAIFAAGAGNALAQTVYDASDPAITERPRIGQKFRVPAFPVAYTRDQERGEVTLDVCVDVAGHVVAGDMVQSSGYSRLDQATVDWIRSGPIFEPALAGNTSVAVCNYTFTYVWGTPRGSHNDPTKGYLDWKDVSSESRPTIIEQVDGPVYPLNAVAKRLAGPVQLSLCISPFGRMVSAKVVEGDEESSLVGATKSWIGRFTFKPGMKDGQPVGVCGFPIKYDWELPN